MRFSQWGGPLDDQLCLFDQIWYVGCVLKSTQDMLQMEMALGFWWDLMDAKASEVGVIWAWWLYSRWIVTSKWHYEGAKMDFDNLQREGVQFIGWGVGGSMVKMQGWRDDQGGSRLNEGEAHRFCFLSSNQKVTRVTGWVDGVKGRDESTRDNILIKTLVRALKEIVRDIWGS